jgi:hypothetical protein
MPDYFLHWHALSCPGAIGSNVAGDQRPEPLLFIQHLALAKISSITPEPCV